MPVDDVLVDLMNQMLWLAMALSLPPLLAAMVIGLVIGLLQAITSIQEQTLSFVPKIVVILAVYMITGSWMLRLLTSRCGDLLAALPQYGAL
jgi:flagellar biosynthetic protein FliQ